MKTDLLVPSFCLLCSLPLACGPEITGDDVSDETSGDTDLECELPEAAEYGAEGCSLMPGPRPDCRVRQHAVIECEEAGNFTSGGIRVAADDEGAMLLASSDDTAWLFRTRADAYEVESLPDPLVGALPLLSQDAEGNVAFMSDNYDYDPMVGPVGGIHFLARDGEGGWIHEQLFGPEQRGLKDFELERGGVAHFWYIQEGTSEKHRMTRTGPDEWSAQAEPAYGGISHDNLGPQNEALRYEYDEQGPGQWQLFAFEGDSGEALGAPLSVPDIFYSEYIALPPARPALEGAGPRAMVAAFRHEEGIHVLGSGGYDVAIPGTEQLDPTCEAGPECAGTCNETGGGIEESDFAAARAADGSVWVGWVKGELDQELSWYEECDEFGCYCSREIESDASVYILHLARVDPGGEVEEVTSMEVSPLMTNTGYDNYVTRAIDMRAFGDRLAVGLRVGVHPEQARLHLLEIDIAQSM